MKNLKYLLSFRWVEEIRQLRTDYTRLNNHVCDLEINYLKPFDWAIKNPPKYKIGGVLDKKTITNIELKKAHSISLYSGGNYSAIVYYWQYELLDSLGKRTIQDEK